MSNNNSSQHFQVAVADPTPLGLMGLAVVTMVASAAKLGIVSNVAWVLPWALFCGAGAQVVAGVLDYLHKNIFGGTVFCAFGFFWFGVGMSWMIKAGAFGEALLPVLILWQSGLRSLRTFFSLLQQRLPPPRRISFSLSIWF